MGSLAGVITRVVIWFLWHGLFHWITWRSCDKVFFILFCDVGSPLDFTALMSMSVLNDCLRRWVVNSVDPDQTPHLAASDLGLHCLFENTGMLWQYRSQNFVEIVTSSHFFFFFFFILKENKQTSPLFVWCELLFPRENLTDINWYGFYAQGRF